MTSPFYLFIYCHCLLLPTSPMLAAFGLVQHFSLYKPSCTYEEDIVIIDEFTNTLRYDPLFPLLISSAHELTRA